MVTIIILSAGNGTRLGLGYNKMFYKIDGIEMYKKTLAAFNDFDKIILVANEKEINDYTVPKNVRIVAGGKTRGESVYKALLQVDTPYVLIHDGARPFIKRETILKCVEALNKHDSIAVGVTPKNTIKDISNGMIKTLSRNNLLEMQTPQGGKTSLYKAVYRKAFLENYETTDDCALVEKYSEELTYFIDGEYDNIKITTIDDINESLIGHSWDVHQLTEGRPLILGGIIIPFEKGLLGHSDADVLLHVIGESILGALSLGDLGHLFPDNDPSTLGISSKTIVEDIWSRMDEMGYMVSNIDTTIYAQKPKMAPYILDMRESISKLLHMNINRVSVKATTYEHLGEIGQGLAIASEAVVMLKKKR